MKCFESKMIRHALFRVLQDYFQQGGVLVETLDVLLDLIPEGELLHRLIDKDSAIVKVLGAEPVAEILKALEGDVWTCPGCGSGPAHWRYVEDIQNWRKVRGLEDGKLMIEGRYENGEGYDDGTFAYYECHALNEKNEDKCLHIWPMPPLPDGIELDFVS